MPNRTTHITDTHSELIERLLHFRKHENYDSLFAQNTADLSNSQRFLLKMELGRLCKPCQRHIDFRGRADVPCKEIEIKGVKHFLPPKAEAFLEQQLARFHGDYTIGVFEAMMKAEPKLNQAHHHLDSELTAKARAINLGRLIHRKEERLHLVTPLIIKDQRGRRYNASSSNMSLSGIRVRVKEQSQFTDNERLQVYFSGLEKEFANPILRQGIWYRLIDSTPDKQGAMLRLVLEETTPAFRSFFEKYLNAYKGRYRVDVDNTRERVMTRGYQQFLLPRLNALPLYFDHQHSLRYVLSNAVNQKLLSYWRDENNTSRLGQLFSPTRMARYAEQKTGESLLFCFTHTANEQLYFYAASLEELNEDPPLKALFFSFGAHKPSWRVFKWQWQHGDILSSINKANKQQRLNEVEQERVHRALDDIRQVALLSDITTDFAFNGYRTRYQSDANPNQLARFNLNKAPEQPFEQVPYKYRQLRKESRYEYRSKVVVENHENKISDGWCRDFSQHGMQIELDKPLGSHKGELVYLALPQFQQLVKSYKLRELAYEVVNLNREGTILNLRALQPKTHEGCAFFKQLIANNLSKLNPVPENTHLAILSESLRHALCEPLFCRALFVSAQSSHFEVSAFAYGDIEQAIDELFSIDKNKGLCDLRTWLDCDDNEGRIIDRLKHLSPESEASCVHLLLSLDNDGKLVGCIDMASFPDVSRLHDYLIGTLREGRVMSIKLHINRLGRLDTEHIQRELNYISNYAMHKAKQLEDELWSLRGAVQITDTTLELYTQFNLSLT